MQTKKEDDQFLIWVLVILLVILTYLIYTASLGQIDITPHKDNEPFIDKKRLAEERHKKLLALIEQKKELKEKLAKHFKTSYLFVRILFVAMYLGFNALLFFVFNIKDLGTILNWNEVLLLILITINFITFGTITDLKNVIGYFRNRIENWVYGKYVNIEEQIVNHIDETKILQEEFTPIINITANLEQNITLIANKKDNPKN
ncbi:MAG: hypothetical protein HOO89_06855 [Ferruginibacter sp.]|nr:hypothetical protein [Ferruginibacter sp.]